jgi:hypothetical protein
MGLLTTLSPTILAVSSKKLLGSRVNVKLMSISKLLRTFSIILSISLSKLSFDTGL